MKIRQARKIYKAFYSLKPNYWNGYKRFTLLRMDYGKNHRIDCAIRKAYWYERKFPIPTKPIAIQGTTSTRHPRYGLWLFWKTRIIFNQ